MTLRLRRGPSAQLPTVAGGYWYNFAESGGIIVAVGMHNDNSAIYTAYSSDGGATWSTPVDIYTATIYTFWITATAGGFCIIVNNGIFPSTNHALTSPDGAAWTLHAVPTTSGSPNMLRYHGARVLAMFDGDDAFLTSDDGGATWAARTLPHSGNQTYGMAYNGTALIVPSFTFDGSNHYWINRSTNLGTTWVATEILQSEIGLAFNAPGSTDLRLIGGNYAVNRLSVDDGVTWVSTGSWVNGNLYAGIAGYTLAQGSGGNNPAYTNVSYDGGANWQTSPIISAGFSFDDFQVIDGVIWLLDNPPDGETATLQSVIQEAVPHYHLRAGEPVAIDGEATWDFFVPADVKVIQFWGDLTAGRGAFDYVVDPDGDYWDWEVDAGNVVSFDYDLASGLLPGQLLTGTIGFAHFIGPASFKVLLPFWTGFINCVDDGT